MGKGQEGARYRHDEAADGKEGPNPEVPDQRR
jgi:hypothetical protein